VKRNVVSKKVLKILATFPKIRNPLPLEYQAIYSNYYKINRHGNSQVTSFSKKMERWMHRKVAKNCRDGYAKTLELGAGTLNQLDYEKPKAPYDIVEPFSELYQNSIHLEKIRYIYNDIREIPIKQSYERITSIAVFEHLVDLPQVTAITTLLLESNGILQVAIPNEGRWLWRLGYTLSTGMEFMWRYKLNYNLMMRYEHVNSAREIEAILNYFFQKVSYADFGFGKYASIYRYIECSEPRTELAKTFLAGRAF
jgi:hypothetical protein